MAELSTRQLPASWVDRIFYRMQGLYGSLWLQRWKTGEINADGADLGLLSAKAVWAEALAGVSGEAISAAITACQAISLPPTLPEFLSLCRDAMRRSDATPKLRYVPTDEEREQQREAAERIAAATKAKQAQRIDDGLHWATHPGSKIAVREIHKEAQSGNKVLARVWKNLVEDGIVSDTGKALKLWSNGAWVPA